MTHTKLRARDCSGGWKPALLFILWLLVCPLAKAEEITIAAASDMSFVFQELVPDFEKETGNKVRLSLGSSGNLYSQIQNGAPFDLFFSADLGYPKKLESEGFAVGGSVYEYAVGRIVLSALKDSAIDVQKLGMNALLHPSVRKIAIANPRHAPYGAAAISAIRHFQLYDRTKDKLVYGENVSQAAQFVESGAAEIGVIALSLALSPQLQKKGSFWEIPAKAYPSLKQAAVILKQAKNSKPAEAFLRYLQQPAGLAILRRYGFTMPEKTQP